MDKKIRILAAGDLHGDIAQAEKLAQKAEDENVDLIILTGDITHFGGSAEGLIGPLVKRNKKVFLIPGNHENVETINLLTDNYGVKNLHGYYAILGDVAFFGCGGATKVGPVLRLDEEEVKYMLERGHKKIKDFKRKIMITHEHPTGSIIDKLIPNSGSKSIREAVDKFKPDFVLCGHIHEAAGIEEKIGLTTVINVGKAGKIIEL